MKNSFGGPEKLKKDILLVYLKNKLTKIIKNKIKNKKGFF